MIHKANTPSEYLEILQPDWRKETLLEIRSQILDHSDMSEVMNWGMLGYKMAKQEPFIHLNAQRNYVSIYVGNIDKVPGAEELLSGYNRGKGCLRLTKTKSPKDAPVMEFIRRAIEFYRSGGNIDC
jgi:hypothetical protein